MMGFSIFSRKPWALHNPLKSWTLKDLSDHELKLLTGTLTVAERQLCLLWRTGWSEWQRLCQSEGFKSPAPPIEIEGLPPIPSNALHAEGDDITQVKTLAKGPARLRQDRRHGRHEVRVPVEIIQGEQSFRTETLDISYSGVRFKDPIPDWVAGYFTVVFRGPGQAFEITCALVEDQKDQKDCAEVFDTNDEESGLKDYFTWVNSL